jgi:hypothetical protein
MRSHRIGALAMGYEPSGVVFSGFRWIATFELGLPKLRRAHFCL